MVTSNDYTLSVSDWMGNRILRNFLLRFSEHFWGEVVKSAALLGVLCLKHLSVNGENTLWGKDDLVALVANIEYDGRWPSSPLTPDPTKHAPGLWAHFKKPSSSWRRENGIPLSKQPRGNPAIWQHIIHSKKKIGPSSEAATSDVHPPWFWESPEKATSKQVNQAHMKRSASASPAPAKPSALSSNARTHTEDPNARSRSEERNFLELRRLLANKYGRCGKVKKAQGSKKRSKSDCSRSRERVTRQGRGYGRDDVMGPWSKTTTKRNKSSPAQARSSRDDHKSAPIVDFEEPTYLRKPHKLGNPRLEEMRRLREKRLHSPDNQPSPDSSLHTLWSTASSSDSVALELEEQRRREREGQTFRLLDDFMNNPRWRNFNASIPPHSSLRARDRDHQTSGISSSPHYRLERLLEEEDERLPPSSTDYGSPRAAASHSMGNTQATGYSQTSSSPWREMGEYNPSYTYHPDARWNNNNNNNRSDRTVDPGMSTPTSSPSYCGKEDIPALSLNTGNTSWNTGASRQYIAGWRPAAMGMPPTTTSAARPAAGGTQNSNLTPSSSVLSPRVPSGLPFSHHPAPPQQKRLHITTQSTMAENAVDRRSSSGPSASSLSQPNIRTTPGGWACTVEWNA